MNDYALLGFVVILAVSFIRGTNKYHDFLIGVCVVTFCFSLTPFAMFISWLRPMTIDGMLRQTDLALGLDGFALTRWAASQPWRSAIVPVYLSIPLALATAWALERSRTLIRTTVIATIGAFFFYLLVPASGPVWAYHSFPLDGPAVSRIDWFHPRNCFPSMHFGWALLIAFNLRDWRWRWFFILYAIAMAFVPIMVGEHYFVDMIAAIPFTLVVQILCEKWEALHATAV